MSQIPVNPEASLAVSMMKYIAQIGNQSFEITILDDGHIQVGDEVLRYDFRPGSRTEHFSLIIDGRSYQIWMEPVNQSHRVHVAGYDFEVHAEDERAHRLRRLAATDAASSGVGQVVAPMPGLVVKALVEPGQAVKRGDGIVIVEAMKMENEIRSPLSGTVKEIRVKSRQAVEKGEILAVIG